MCFWNDPLLMHPSPLWYDEALVDEGLAAYTVRVERLYGKVNYLVTYLVVARDNETSVAAANRVMHIKVCKQTSHFI